LMKKLIYKRSGLLLPRSISKVFCLKKIISIEAKIKDWRKAIEQAIMNTWYASHSYVLFPRTSISIKAIGSAKKYGIGIISFEENKPKVLLKPLIRKLPASYGSWMLNDLIIHNKTRTGDDYIGRYKN